MDVERATQELTERVRSALLDAQEHARQIVAEAEADAARIRDRAETEARERLAQVRQVLADLEGAVAAPAEPAAERPAAEDPAAEVQPPAVPEPVPTPPVEPEPSPPPIPEPSPPSEPEPTPPDPEIEPPAPAQPDRESPAANGANGLSGDRTAARIVATKMALDGAPRDEIAARIESEYSLGDAEQLVDDVLARAKR